MKIHNLRAPRAKLPRTLPQYTSIGSYTILYTGDGVAYCAKCAELERFREKLVAGTFDEGAPYACDGCETEIESSYGDPDAESGYTHCACPDCFETTVSDDMRKPELCSGCEVAGCDGSGECQCESESES